MRPVVAIIQARMGSSRLPGKVMRDLCGRPVLVRVLERVQNIIGVDKVIVATTPAPLDRLVVETAEAAGVAVFCGSEQDVLDRFYQAARQSAAKTVLRFTADCPLLVPAVCASVLSRYWDGCDGYVSNIHPPTFPDGLDTEVFSMDLLETAWREAILPFDREHVTPYLWKNQDRFRLINVMNSHDFSSYRWTLDREEDLIFIRAVYRELGPVDSQNFENVLAFSQSRPELRAGNDFIVRQ